jgi:hypothetical protein
MLQYLRWIWYEAPRSLRVEFLVTILVIELLALATMVVLTNSTPAPVTVPAEESAARDGRNMRVSHARLAPQR